MARFCCKFLVSLFTTKDNRWYTLPERLEAHEENVDFDVTECSSFQTCSKKSEAKYATTDCWLMERQETEINIILFQKINLF